MDNLIKTCKVFEIEKIGLTALKQIRLLCGICDKNFFNDYKDNIKDII